MKLKPTRDNVVVRRLGEVSDHAPTSLHLPEDRDKREVLYRGRVERFPALSPGLKPWMADGVHVGAVVLYDRTSLAVGMHVEPDLDVVPYEALLAVVE